MKKSLVLILVCLSSGSIHASESLPAAQPGIQPPPVVAEASGVNILRVVGAFGLYSKLTPVDNGFGAGVDYGSYLNNGFSINFQSRYFFEAHGSTSGSSTTVFAKNMLFGIAPGYSLNSGHSRTTFGVFVGGLQTQTETRTNGSTTADESKTRLAIGPSVSIDIKLTESIGLSFGGLFVFTNKDYKPGVNSGSLGVSFLL